MLKNILIVHTVKLTDFNSVDNFFTTISTTLQYEVYN